MAIAQKVAGYSLGQADLLRKAMGKKKSEILDAEYVPFEAGMTANGYSRTRDQGAVGHPGAVLRLRLQQGALRGVRPGVLLDGLPQGQLPAGVHGGAPDLGQGRQGQDRDLPQRVPPDEDPGAAARRQRVRGDFTAGRRRHPLRAHRDPQRRRERRRPDRRGPARSRAGSPTSTTSWRKVPALVCNKRVIESLVKAGAFDEMGHGRRALVAIHEQAVDQYVEIKRNEAIGQDSLFGGLDDDGLRLRDGDRRPRDRRVGQDDAARPRAGDARPLRLRPPAARPRAPAGRRQRLQHRPADARRGASRRQPDHRHRPDHLGAAQDHQEGRHLGRGHRRGPRRRDRRAALPGHLPARRQPPGRGRDRHGARQAVPQQGPARDPRRGGHRFPTSPTTAPARWW